jgi:conjugal transfer/type IV secretion protein DotA/TraY
MTASSSAQNSPNTSGRVTTRQVLKYVALPGIRPRIAELFGQGFHYIPYFIALIYECVRLLPAGHPYLNTQNLGRFGVRHVIAEAANNLELSRKNIDQIAVFVLILVAMIIILLQIILMIMAVTIQPGFSFPANFSEFFITGAYPGTEPHQDIAMIFLDMVFGVPELFNSCVDPAQGVACTDGRGAPILIADNVLGTGAGGADLVGLPITQWADWPYPVHLGLHQLLAVYSYGMLVVAVFITMYFIAVVIAETAQTGTPFGKRFNKVWAPIRIVIAFGLLMPLTNGLNSGQYIVLYAAKFGSGFASNGWHHFNTTITNGYFEGVNNLVATPNFPESNALLQFFHVAATCNYLYLSTNTGTPPLPPLRAYVLGNDPLSPNDHLELTPRPPGALASYVATNSYEDVLNFLLIPGTTTASSRITVRFGVHDPTSFGMYPYSIKPLCGEVSMNLEDSRLPGSATPPEPGPEIIQRHHWLLIKALWHSRGQLDVTTLSAFQYWAHQNVTSFPNKNIPAKPTEALRNQLVDRMAQLYRAVLTTGSLTDTVTRFGETAAIPAQEESGSWDVDPVMAEKGWAGAAIWYNKIAEMNGAVTSAIFNIPMPTKYPEIMEYVKRKRIENEQNVPIAEQFNPAGIVDPQVPRDDPFATAMFEAYDFWQEAGLGTTTQTESTGNIFFDTINAILGTDGLFAIRENENTHPLAQLVGIGRSLIEASIRNLGYIGIAGAGGSLIASINQQAGAGAIGLARVFGDTMLTITMISITAGFILFYIVPFLPFIYFFFAVGGWIKGIFEAMVGVPLWALAHIRIDGNGMPGNAAMNGYYLIFEIFLRPLLTVFGFIGSIIIFAAMVNALNDMWDLVISNVGGFDMQQEIATPGSIDFYRGPVDEFIFTVMYAIIVYMMAQSSFKLIDLVPNSILRWMGASVATFNDSRQDPTSNLVGTASFGANQATQSLGGGIRGLLKAGMG